MAQTCKESLRTKKRPKAERENYREVFKRDRCAERARRKLAEAEAPAQAATPPEVNETPGARRLAVSLRLSELRRQLAELQEENKQLRAQISEKAQRAVVLYTKDHATLRLWCEAADPPADILEAEEERPW